MGEQSFSQVVKGQDKGQHKDLMKHLKKLKVSQDVLEEFERSHSSNY